MDCLMPLNWLFYRAGVPQLMLWNLNHFTKLKRCNEKFNIWESISTVNASEQCWAKWAYLYSINCWMEEVWSIGGGRERTELYRLQAKRRHPGREVVILSNTSPWPSQKIKLYMISSDAFLSIFDREVVIVWHGSQGFKWPRRKNKMAFWPELLVS
jgi:hypothetical protein